MLCGGLEESISGRRHPARRAPGAQVMPSAWTGAQCAACQGRVDAGELLLGTQHGQGRLGLAWEGLGRLPGRTAAARGAERSGGRLRDSSAGLSIERPALPLLCAAAQAPGMSGNTLTAPARSRWAGGRRLAGGRREGPARDQPRNPRPWPWHLQLSSIRHYRHLNGYQGLNEEDQAGGLPASHCRLVFELLWAAGRPGLARSGQATLLPAHRIPSHALRPGLNDRIR